jgi:hypothetical protein
LIFGRIEKKNVIDYIDKLLGTENKRQDWEEPVRGFTCLSALVLDEDGEDLISEVIYPQVFLWNSGIRTK